MGRYRVGHRGGPGALWRVVVVMSVTALVLLAAVAAASAATLHVTSSTDGTAPGPARCAAVIAVGREWRHGRHRSGGGAATEQSIRAGISISATATPLTIEGQGARSTTITGDSADSTFSLLNGCGCNPTLTITGVTMTGGGGSRGRRPLRRRGHDCDAYRGHAVGEHGQLHRRSGPRRSRGCPGGRDPERRHRRREYRLGYGRRRGRGGRCDRDREHQQQHDHRELGEHGSAAGLFNEGQTVLVGDTLAGNQTTAGNGGNIGVNAPTAAR